MKPIDRTRLTAALRDHVARIAADLRRQMQGPGPVRERARLLHAQEQVGEDFDVWTDLLSRRAAVLWVLKSVYVRVLEDRGLVSPGRLLDPEAQQLFEKLAPNLGQTAFLRWVYRDLASPVDGLPELFAPQPAEVAEPADELSLGLVEFWRHKDPDTGACWNFAQERFEGELMGDLYQELDPVVKSRFALCQTPDFVRGFILDRTLTPAIEEFGAERVRLLDPACGSGHFLIDGLKRLVAAMGTEGADRRRVVAQCLERVVGMDLNDYACALARARLVMTAAELAGASTLKEAAAFHPQVYWADGLEQVEKGPDNRGQQLDLLDASRNVEVIRASLTRPEVRAVLRGVLEPGFHAVVANPPYIMERDEKRKEYHREKVGRTRRYVSASGKYSLGAPFTERCFQLAVKEGFVGLIVSNNFMKREFGKSLIEDVLTKVDLTLVVDTSQAYIPFHATPTVLIFGRHRTACSSAVRAVMGKRGEMGTPQDPAKGRVWAGIVNGWNTVGFDSEFISTADVAREVFTNHPWSLGGGGVLELKDRLELAQMKLGAVAVSIGYTTICGEDSVFLADAQTHLRRHVESLAVPMVVGDILRDWAQRPGEAVLYPYDGFFGKPLAENTAGVQNAFWRYRTTLQHRLIFGETPAEKGMIWYEHMYRDLPKLSTPLSITFSFVATHNHFVLDRGGKVFNRSAPVIKLPPEVTEQDHLALLGLLNSSTACFWMKQIFYPKGSGTKDLDKAGLVPENNRYEFTGTGMQSFPIPASWNDPAIIQLAGSIDNLSQQRQCLSSGQILSKLGNVSRTDVLRSALDDADALDSQLRRRMVFLQEELDWFTYQVYGLHQGPLMLDSECGIEPEQRPFCWQSDQPPAELPAEVRAAYCERRAAITANPDLALIETPVFKRLWRGTQGIFGRYDRTYEDKARTAMAEWLAGKVETAISQRAVPVTVEQVAAALQADVAILAVAEVLTGRKDFHLSNLVSERLLNDAVPNHRFHVYTESGLDKRAAWERTWDEQRREDAGETITPQVPPQYTQADFLKTDYYRHRGKLDVPKERFISFTEVPGRDAASTLYGWAGWTPLQRLKAILSIDEDLEDAFPKADRMGLLDSAWRLLPDVARDDPQSAGRLKAELQSMVGLDGPSKEMLEDWRKRFPPPGQRPQRGDKVGAKRNT